MALPLPPGWSPPPGGQGTPWYQETRTNQTPCSGWRRGSTSSCRSSCPSSMTTWPGWAAHRRPSRGQIMVRNIVSMMFWWIRILLGEIVLVDSREEAARLSDRWGGVTTNQRPVLWQLANHRYAPEHLEIQTVEDDWYHDNLRNYGSLFLGEGSTVTHGDKASGPNHVLPTRRVARSEKFSLKIVFQWTLFRYTGGLSVEKFLKKLTWQRLSKESQK